MLRALKRAGFQEHHQTGSHLFLRHPETRQMTSVPIHPRDLKRGTTRAIIKQAGLTVEELLDLL